MIYLLWLLPTLAVAAGILSGRLDTTRAALLGLVCAVPVALASAPLGFDAAHLVLALQRGLWIGLTITPYILGGLLFWQVALPGSSAPDDSAAGTPVPGTRLAQRRLVFLACFLIGPFAESATGFGVGMLASVALLRRLQLGAPRLMLLALLSQTLIPWGAMGSGTLLAAAYARVPAAALGAYSMLPIALLMLCAWLPLYWRTLNGAGLRAPLGEALLELGWVALALAALTFSTLWLGPETALLAAFGPLIVLHVLVTERPSRRELLALARKALPYALLIGALVSVRLVPSIKAALLGWQRLAPYPDLPAWSPLLHAGTWLIAGALLCALLRGQTARLGGELRSAWHTGRNAVLTVFIFSMMSEVLSIAGISQACAAGLFAALGGQALLLTPLIAGAFGVLANTGNAPNSLFMSAQVTLASQAGLSLPAVAALQHVCATAAGLFSPVRMSIASALCQGAGHERAVYRALFPYAAIFLAVLTLGAVAVIRLG
ncbi:MAG: hypothetical protein GAK45_00210 [Pseudomonas citronellolis]|nr:MAG: hypothetical protein GAK45_00210 [Pseudomonas citronellolis]